MESIVLWGFNLYAWITIVTVLTMFTVLLLTKIRADLVFLGAIAILFVTGVLNAKEAFSGFSSTSVVIIGVLFVVVAGLTHTGVLQWIVKHLLGQPETYSKAVIRLMLPVAGLSSFLSNTTVVALFVGIHHGGGAVCGHREDVVEETWHLSLEAAHPAELCLWHGWRVYVDRYAAKPDYLRSLC